ncbi:MAG: SRPBCC domain-containing protein [Alcanivorax sp.]|nr:SRPBCC domain-containing protein [Alcanivorax sp.]
MKISISTTVSAPIERVWEAWITPDEITQWTFASADWCCPSARLDLSPGGSFCYRMEARDGSVGFDFEGVFTEVEIMKSITFELGDGRFVLVSFSESGGGETIVEEIFEAEDEHSGEQQRLGWQAILENFKLHVEASIA